MNREYYLSNLPDENSANSQENVFNNFDIEHIPNNDNIDPDTNLYNNQFDVVDQQIMQMMQWAEVIHSARI